jgi:hypothetical protein
VNPLTEIAKTQLDFSVGTRAVADRPGLDAKRWIALLALCFSALLMYGALWPQAPLSNTDTTGYLEPLHDFVAHHRFTQLHGRTPGLPFFLFVTGTGRGYFYAGLLLYLAGVANLVFLLFRLRVRDWLVWTFAFLVFLPPFTQNVAYIASEGLTEALLMLGFGLLGLYILDNRWGYCLIASLLFGWAGLTRTTNVVTPFLLAAIIIASPMKRLRRGAVVLVCVPALILGSYAAYNGVRFRYFGLSFMNGYHLTLSTVGMYEYIDNPIAREELLKARKQLYEEGLAPSDAAVWQARPGLEKRLGLSDMELGRFLAAMNLRLIVHHPEAYIEGSVETAVINWFPYITKILSTGPVFKLVWDGLQLAVVAIFLFQVTILASLVAGSRILHRKLLSFTSGRSLVYVLALAIIFQTEILSSAVVGGSHPRYRSVVDPLIIFCVALIAEWCIRTSRSSRGEIAGIPHPTSAAGGRT